MKTFTTEQAVKQLFDSPESWRVSSSKANSTILIGPEAQKIEVKRSLSLGDGLIISLLSGRSMSLYLQEGMDAEKLNNLIDFLSKVLS